MHEGERRRERLMTAAVVVLGVAAVAASIWVMTHRERPPESPAAVSYTPEPQEIQPAALWVGDSYTAGAGAASANGGAACLASTELGWICNLDAQGSTGFLAGKTASGYEALSERLPRTRNQMLADIIVVDAGRNDRPYPLRQVKAAAVSYFASLREAWPRARLVFIAPYMMTSELPPLGETWVPFLRREAAKYDAVVIDPLGEGWMRPALVASMTVPKDQRDALHPDPSGHRYIAEHLARILREKVGVVPITDMRGDRS